MPDDPPMNRKLVDAIASSEWRMVENPVLTDRETAALRQAMREDAEAEARWKREAEEAAEARQVERRRRWAWLALFLPLGCAFYVAAALVAREVIRRPYVEAAETWLGMGGFVAAGLLAHKIIRPRWE